jgi:5-methylcytosine-specific restriction protein A
VTLSVCAQPGCPELVTARYCEQHEPPPRPGRRMPTDWKRTRKRILERDSHRCRLRLPGCKDKATSVDHIVPASRGGTDADHNLVACCWPCNQKKGNR